MNYQQHKQLRRRKGLIFFRYCFPLLTILLILISMRIPCLQYTTADTGKNDVISAHELMANAWEQARQCLFGGMDDPTQASIAFSKTVMTVIMVCCILFLVGIAAAVWTWITAWRFFHSPKEGDRARIAFITLSPNRTVLCLWLLCLLPLPAFPRLLVIIYGTMMNYTVAMDVTFAEPLILALALWLIHLILSAATANAERTLGMDFFRSLQSKEHEEENGSSAEAAPSLTESNTITQQAKEEQLAHIRQLFGGEDNKNDEI